MVRLIAAVCLLTASHAGYCQYLDFLEPEKLSASVNSEDEEIMPLLSPDGRTLFFSRVLHNGNEGGRFSGSDVWISSLDQGAWKKATNTTHSLNSKANDAVIGISSDGKVVYLMKASSDKKLNGIYFSKQTGNSWSTPELLPISGLDNSGFSSFYVSPDFDVIFISMEGRDTKGKEDIYVSLKDASGEWSRPRNLGPTINTSGFEMSPFLSADKRFLYFASNGHQGFGDADIFCSERLYNSWETWSVPRNLGKTINSASFDAYFSIYGDSISYFSSNRQGKLSNIYTSRIAISTFSLDPGQRFLEEYEVQELVGKNVVTSVSFAEGASDIPSSLEELLFYISNRVIKNEKVKILFVSGNSPLASKRLSNLVNYFVSNGFEADRLFISEMRKGPKVKEKENVIQLRFFTQ